MECKKCGTVLVPNANFCFSCGTKVSKDGAKIQPINNNLIKIEILASVIVFLIVAYLVYAYITIGSINSNAFGSQPSAIGDGATELQIFIYPMTKLGTEMSANIAVQADKGNVSISSGNSKGEYEIEFIPPKVAAQTTANITISANGLTKSILVSVLPDQPTNLELNASSESIPADGESGTVITVYATDKNSEPVPDGTDIYFSQSPIGSGQLSQTFCITQNGECRISYVSSISPGITTVSANSGNATNAINLTLEKLPPTILDLLAGSTNLPGDGSTTTIVSATIKNKIGNPVTNYPINFSADLGTYISDSCNTDSEGKCSVTYIAARVAGQDSLNACAASACSSVAITLNPVSEISVLNFAESAYVGGNPTIVPIFAINHDYLGQQLVTLEIENNGSGDFNGQISVSIPGWATSDTQQVDIPANSVQTFNFNPELNSQALSNNQLQTVSYLLTIQNANGQTVYQNNYPTQLSSFNTMDWFGGETSNLIAAWVTPNAPSIHQLISSAATSLPDQAILGYGQTYDSGCGSLGTSSCNAEETTYLQLQAIYNQLQSENMHYVNAPTDFSGSQTIYTPEQSLLAGGANCIDGTLVFASAAVATGMTAYVALVPSHAFVCIDTTSEGNEVYCIETTMIGSGSTFEQALTEGNSEYNQYESAGTIDMINVNNVLSSGVQPLPS